MGNTLLYLPDDCFCFELKSLYYLSYFSVWREVNYFSEYKIDKMELSQNEVRYPELLIYIYLVTKFHSLIYVSNNANRVVLHSMR
jgi:hypothetical protein